MEMNEPQYMLSMRHLPVRHEVLIVTKYIVLETLLSSLMLI